MEDSYQPTNPAYPCDECGKIFSTTTNLDSHKAYTHHIEVSICEYCSCEFKNKQKLRKHILYVHKDHANYICDMCSKAFKNHSLLYSHQKTVHEVTEGLICSICGIQMMNAYKLQKHLRRCERKGPEELKSDKITEESLTCKECNKTFISRKSLKGHNKVVHSYDPARCQICHTDFKNIPCFRQHLMRSHLIIDPVRIFSLIKDVKPNFEEYVKKKKSNRESNLSEYQEQRNALVNEWKKIEKEKHERDNLKSSDGEQAMAQKCDLDEDTTEESLEVKSEPNNELETSTESKSERNDEFETSTESKSEPNDELETSTESKQNMKTDTTYESCPFCDDKIFKSKIYFSLHMKQFHNDNQAPQIKTNEIDEDEEMKDTSDLLYIKLEVPDEQDVNIKPEKNEDYKTKSVSEDNLPEKRKVLDETREQEARLHECDECGKLFSELRNLKGHIKTAHTFEPCTCPYCEGTILKNKIYLSQHMKRFHKDLLPKEPTTKIKSFICDLCGKAFRDNGKLNSHKKTHSDERKQCPYCPNIYKYLNNHIKDVHNKVECVCPQCGKTCMSKVALRGHMSTVHPSEEKRRICSLCGKEFKNTASLRQHQRKTFGCAPVDADSYVTCPECGKEFMNKHALYNHHYHTHVIQNVNCPKCGTTCKNKVALSKHIKRTCSVPLPREAMVLPSMDEYTRD